ncbi:unnamed protein product [Prunus armeniaca]
MYNRLGPRRNIHACLGPQGNVHERLGSHGRQPNNHRNEDCEERSSAARSQRNVHERIDPQGGQLDNPHNQDCEERRFTAFSQRTNSHHQAIENPSQAMSTNTPSRQRSREGRTLRTNEEANQCHPNHEGHQHD